MSDSRAGDMAAKRRIWFLFLLFLIFFVPVETYGDGGECRHVKVLADGEYYPALIDAIDGAQQTITMAFFLFKTSGYGKSYPDTIVRHLIEAVRRGVRVTVILEQDSDARSSVTANNRETAERLEKGNVTVRFDGFGRTTHAKVVVLDDRYVLLGSHNLTNSALKYNHEMSLFIDSPAVAGEVLRYLGTLH